MEFGREEFNSREIYLQIAFWTSWNDRINEKREFFFNSHVFALS